MRRTRQGLTLAEVLVTLGLLAVIVQLSAAVIRRLGQTTTRQQSGEAFLVSLDGFERMRLEVLQAVSIQSPIDSVFVENLAFTRLQPNAVGRLPDSPEEWNPKAPEHLVRVRYYLREDSLIREEIAATGLTTGHPVATDVDSFLVAKSDNNVLEFRFSFRVGKVLKPFKAKVLRLLP